MLVGETFTLRVRIAESEIPVVAKLMHDANPLHSNVASARAAGYPGLIACGPHLAGIFMGMTATHFSQPGACGRNRSPLGLGFDVAFRAPVFADEDIDLRWSVTGVERKDRLDGWIAQMQGEARSARALLIAGTGALLIRLWESHRAAR